MKLTLSTEPPGPAAVPWALPRSARLGRAPNSIAPNGAARSERASVVRRAPRRYPSGGLSGRLRFRRRHFSEPGPAGGRVPALRERFANAPWTKPSIATLFTSLPPGGARRDGHGEGDLVRRGDSHRRCSPEEAETLAERFQSAGYRTAAFVANPFISPRHGYCSRVRGLRADARAPRSLLASARTMARGERIRPERALLSLPARHGRPWTLRRLRGKTSRRSSARSTRRVRGRSPRKSTPGFPGTCETEWASEEERPIAWTPGEPGTAPGSTPSTGPSVRSSTSFARAGVLDRAYVVLTSDHGEELLEHGGWNHGNNLYDHQLHVPLLIRKPLARGRRPPSRLSGEPHRSDADAPRALAESKLLRGSWAATSRRLFEAGAMSGTSRFSPSAVNEQPSGSGRAYALAQADLGRGARSSSSSTTCVADPGECRDLSEEDAPSVARMKTYLREHLERNEARGALAREAVAHGRRASRSTESPGVRTSAMSAIAKSRSASSSCSSSRLRSPPRRPPISIPSSPAR